MYDLRRSAKRDLRHAVGAMNTAYYLTCPNLMDLIGDLALTGIHYLKVWYTFLQCYYLSPKFLQPKRILLLYQLDRLS